jgi:hypothetical protein
MTTKNQRGHSHYTRLLVTIRNRHKRIRIVTSKYRAIARNRTGIQCIYSIGFSALANWFETLGCPNQFSASTKSETASSSWVRISFPSGEKYFIFIRCSFGAAAQGSEYLYVTSPLMDAAQYKSMQIDLPLLLSSPTICQIFTPTSIIISGVSAAQGPVSL